MENSPQKLVPKIDPEWIALFEVTWFNYRSEDRHGRVFAREIGVISICAIYPCRKCFECGLASAKRMMRKAK